MTKSKNYNHSNILLFAILGLLLRIVLSFLPSFQIDMGAWFAWADRLVNLGPANFYNPEIWTNYTPGYFYILLVLGWIKKAFVLNGLLLTQLFKLIPNLSDIVTAFLIYKIIEKKSLKGAFLAFIFYVFNPALIFNSSIWGQVDSFLALLMLAAFYFLIEKNNIVASALIYGCAFLVKPQALFLFPILFVWLIKKYNFKKSIVYIAVFLLTSVILAAPFFSHDPFFGLPRMILQMGKDYPYTTLNAFNFWQLLGNWQPDNTLFLGVSNFIWGLLLFIISNIVLITPLLINKKIGKKRYYLSAALILFSFFLFPTRIHERYLLFYFPFMLVAAFLHKSRLLIINYIFMSFLHLINIFYVYDYYYPDYFRFINLSKSNNLPIIISFLTLVSFMISVLIYFKKIKSKILNKINIAKFEKLLTSIDLKTKTQTQPIIIKNAKLYLGLLLGLAFLIRTINLAHPKAYIFDEVYHGFTAQEMAKGNKMAWEWWNTPPEGFAYEWTHPPLAKLVMAGGVLLFSANNSQAQYAFRFPAVIFSLGVIWLTYLIAVTVFKNQRIGLIAAFLVSFEGLSFVMSRIGMADIYFLFFLLLTIFLTLKNRIFFSGISLGLAIVTKWTGIYLYPLIGLILLTKLIKDFKIQKLAKLIPLYLINYFFVPALIYIIVYLPFFNSGHTWQQFIDVQKQMWWYHTNLKATHGYQSPALSWPFMWRPVWLWVNYQENTIANIYNLGNPVIWWTGLFILPFVIYKAFKNIFSAKNFNLGLLIVAYFSFWLPWIFSPRIMFLHHYLPAIPFLCILISWSLENFAKTEEKNKKKYNYNYSLILLYGLLVMLTFIFFYPVYTGVHIPKNLVRIFFWLPSWK
jgi:dolichyl-phosphate-mannose-protein mannosyltransferase